jgi:hypothetical protein
MHSAVLQNKKYIQFSAKNSVEVITMGAIERGVESGDARAARYEEESASGESVEYFVQFPGLTLKDFEGLNRSRARSYNPTNKIPYTAIVDPHTLERMEGWVGGQSAKTVMEAVTAERRRLAKEHGSSIDREQYRDLLESDAAIDGLVGSGEFKKAFDLVGKYSRKSQEWPEALRERLTGMRDRIVEAAREELRRIEETATSDSSGARRELRRLMPALRGTELQSEAEALLKTLG